MEMEEWLCRRSESDRRMKEVIGMVEQDKKDLRVW